MNSGSFPGVDVISGMSYVKDAGFDSVFTGYRNDELCEKIANEAVRLGLAYETIHAPFKGINNIWLPGEEGEAILGVLTTCLESCASHGVPTMIVHLSSGNNAPAINDIGHERFDRLVDLAGYAACGGELAHRPECRQSGQNDLAFVFELKNKGVAAK